MFEGFWCPTFPLLSEPARIAALQASQEAKAAARAAKRAPASSSSIANKSLSAGARSKLKGSSAAVRRGDNMGEVIIDGVVFVFDETGTKLVKKAQQQPSSDSASTDRGAAGATDVAAPGEQTSEGADGASKAPLRTSVNGQAFVRTKRGNLISAELLEKRRAQKESAAKLKRMAALGRQIGENERTRFVCNRWMWAPRAILKLLITSHGADPPGRSLATRL